MGCLFIDICVSKNAIVATDMIFTSLDITWYTKVAIYT